MRAAFRARMSPRMVSGCVFHHTAAPSLRRSGRAERLLSSLKCRYSVQSSKFFKNSWMSSVGRPVKGAGTSELDVLAISSSSLVAELSVSSSPAEEDEDDDVDVADCSARGKKCRCRSGVGAQMIGPGELKVASESDWRGWMNVERTGVVDDLPERRKYLPLVWLSGRLIR